MRVFLRLACLMLLAGSAIAAAPARPNVVLITLDTTRADRMGFLGSRRGLTPNLDALARQGVVFERAYSQAPITSASHATILTGTYPQFNHVNDFGRPLSKSVPYLPQMLHQQGYKTAAFVGSVVLDAKAGAMPGFDGGFDTYDAGFRSPMPGEDRYQTMERRGADVMSRALTWLKDGRGDPFFLWVHLFDPHAPYEAPPPFKGRYGSDPYDGEIAYTDSVVGTLLDQLRASGLYEGALIAVMADHGEAFGEHGERTHGVFLYDETIHVPLLLKMPYGRSAGQRVDVRAGLVDVMPTILDVVRLPVPKTVQGASLAPLMKPPDARGPTARKAAPDRPAYAETDYPRLTFGWSPLRSLRTDTYLFIEAPRPELYDQSADPGARRNLSSTAGAVVRTLAGRLDVFRRRTASSAAPPPTGGVKADLAQNLAALGYLSGGAGTRATGTETTGIDPKDKIEIANQVQEAVIAQEDGRQQEAIRILEKVVAKDPSVAVAFRTLGAISMESGDHGRAVSALRKAIELRLDSSNDRYLLGLALYFSGDLESAKTELQTAIARSSPDDSRSRAKQHYALAGVYDRMGRPADTAKELQTAVRLDPGDFEANLALGRLLSTRGDLTAGVQYLQRSAALQPRSPEPHFFLADAYTLLGQQGNATQERVEAQRLQGLGKP